MKNSKALIFMLELELKNSTINKLRELAKYHELYQNKIVANFLKEKEKEKEISQQKYDTTLENELHDFMGDRGVKEIDQIKYIIRKDY